jgi:putative restriction endonuclease
MLDKFLSEIDRIKVCELKGKPALHKPLLLLAVLTDIYNDGHANRFVFNEYEDRLESLLRNFGWMKVKAYNPHLPFYHLKTSPFWKLEQPEEYQEPSGGPSKSRMRAVKAAASLDKNTYDSLIKNKDRIPGIIRFILNKYWPTSIHDDILGQVGFSMPADAGSRAKRDPKFSEEILRIYERSCAVCGMSCRFDDDLLGLDAAHVQAVQYGGPDIVQNGLALCKLHHWAFDRGAMAIDDGYRVVVSQRLNGVLVERFFRDYNKQGLRKPLKREFEVGERYSKWHRETIFKGPGL